MDRETFRTTESFEFELPDTGAGGESLTATELARSHDYVVAVLLRDHYCPLSRQYVQALATAYEAFAGRSTAVLPVLPDTVGRAAVWQRRYDLPFGLVTDPAAGDEDGNGFDVFGPVATLVSDCPGAALFEADGETLRFVRTVSRDSGADGPDVGALLEAIDEHASDGIVDKADVGPDVEPITDG